MRSAHAPSVARFTPPAHTGVITQGVVSDSRRAQRRWRLTAVITMASSGPCPGSTLAFVLTASWFMPAVSPPVCRFARPAEGKCVAVPGQGVATFFGLGVDKRKGVVFGGMCL